MKEFPPFRLDPDNQCLWRRPEVGDDERIRLTPKAFAVLHYLVEHAGRLVTHAELLEAVWAETYVQPEVLKSHIFDVRRALGDRAKQPRFVETFARRGYQFIAAVRQDAASDADIAPHLQRPALTNLPAPASDLIGRDTALPEVADLLRAQRIVTLTGAGGIGKTRLGLEVAQRLLPDFSDGVWLAELAPLADADLVPDAVAAALGLELAGGVASPDRVARALGPKQLLVVLDNCEHVIDGAARMAEGLSRANPKVRVMATSREPLRAEGEYLYQVPPLDVPAEDAPDPGAMLRHSAVQLFVVRARAATSHFAPEARTATLIGAICRRLDGIPLAIELAAARTATLGVEGVAARLDEARLVGVSLHYLGDQNDARHYLERMLSHYVAPVYRPHAICFQYDQRVMARATLAWILWLQGFPDQAMQTAKRNVEEARASDHALSLSYALAEAACPVALFVGDLATAESLVAMLLDHSSKHALSLAHAWGRYLEGVLHIKRGEALTGLQLLRATFDELGETRFVLRYTAFVGALVEGLIGAGQVAQGRVVIDEALARSERNEERWCLAELLRIKGELLLLGGAAVAPMTAEAHFLHAIDWAHRQRALSWELRAATSLARLWHQQDRGAEARGCLGPVYERFTEGFETADLQAARALLT